MFKHIWDTCEMPNFKIHKKIILFWYWAQLLLLLIGYYISEIEISAHSLKENSETELLLYYFKTIRRQLMTILIN